ncbi:methyltransferase [Weizmannia acidilactici]|uniref:Methyltransferase n=1 Tax=Weizmannia acidilactici TaxID=2607726 RepID=A0A5J4J9J8_9BACI|nr:methyltransferase [Weizmannia acidilactici]GER68648.1 methyltransferase [Weizmannia acidilactici]GER71496.1 methyltransferase [Weizmannia acidilactici]GER73647.1 methyltransferase [Weizmannia acidilactici]
MNDSYIDGLLNIKTTGKQKSFYESLHYNRYEPTPYYALDELFDHYELRESDHVVDFGCGKGRLNFYIYHLFHATVTGVEMNEVFYREALENKKRYEKKFPNHPGRIHFKRCLAEEYEIAPEDNRFYFFNPFSAQIFMKIVQNILHSVEEAGRETDIILYYPLEDYIYFLEDRTPFEKMLEVPLALLYEHNPYEKFVVYRLV